MLGNMPDTLARFRAHADLITAQSRDPTSGTLSKENPANMMNRNPYVNSTGSSVTCSPLRDLHHRKADMPSLPHAKPPQGIPEAQPAWELDAESWIFPFWTSNRALAANKAAQSTSKHVIGGGAQLATKQGLEQGAYHPLEDVSNIGSDIFQGGPGGWILYRYRTSPVGPYDELIYVAGVFRSPATQTKALRITNIYVSTEASVWNGRRNWNIPKHVGRFKWSHGFRDTSGEAQTVEVYHPSDCELDSSRPFFSATLTQSSYMPYLPINTRILPSLPLIQPDVLQGKYDQSTRDSQMSVASEPAGVYRSTAPTFRGRVTLAYTKPCPGRKSYGDGESFPEAKNTAGFGVYLPNVKVDFPWSDDYAASKSK
jgi:hypothetical protein